MGAPAKKATAGKAAPKKAAARSGGRARTAPAARSSSLVIEKPPGLEDLPDDPRDMTSADWDKLQAAIDNSMAGDPIVDENGEITPVEVGKTGKRGPELSHLFTVDRRKYYIPKRVPPAITLQFLADVQNPNVGRNPAVMKAMTNLVGPEGLAALSHSRDVSEDDIARIMGRVAHILFGALRRWGEATDPS